MPPDRRDFFYITGHEIEPALLDGLMNCAKHFFALPEADKLAVEMVKSPHFRGYTRIARERTRGRQDWREQIDIGAEQPMLARLPDAPAWTRLQGPNQWPAALPELRPAVLSWQAAGHSGSRAVAARLCIVARAERRCVRTPVSK